jgi:hypothetical protein
VAVDVHAKVQLHPPYTVSPAARRPQRGVPS